MSRKTYPMVSRTFSAKVGETRILRDITKYSFIYANVSPNHSFVYGISLYHKLESLHHLGIATSILTFAVALWSFRLFYASWYTAISSEIFMSNPIFYMDITDNLRENTPTLNDPSQGLTVVRLRQHQDIQMSKASARSAGWMRAPEMDLHQKSLEIPPWEPWNPGLFFGAPWRHPKTSKPRVCSPKGSYGSPDSKVNTLGVWTQVLCPTP